LKEKKKTFTKTFSVCFFNPRKNQLFLYNNNNKQQTTEEATNSSTPPIATTTTTTNRTKTENQKNTKQTSSFTPKLGTKKKGGKNEEN
jgi:hypothetical protein